MKRSTKLQGVQVAVAIAGTSLFFAANIYVPHIVTWWNAMVFGALFAPLYVYLDMKTAEARYNIPTKESPHER